jgi:hypothetical protein
MLQRFDILITKSLMQSSHYLAHREISVGSLECTVLVEGVCLQVQDVCTGLNPLSVSIWSYIKLHSVLITPDSVCLALTVFHMIHFVKLY